MALSDSEETLRNMLSFDATVFELLKNQSARPVISFFDADGNVVGAAVDVDDGRAAERLINTIQSPLDAIGCRAFWSNRREPSGLPISDVVVILRGTDPYSILDAAKPDGANHHLFTDDIRTQLRLWEKTCSLEIVGASHDWVAVVFHSLPSDVCRFAEEIFLFCPDTGDQTFSKVRKDPVAMGEVRRLCPALSERFRTTSATDTRKNRCYYPTFPRVWRP